MTTRPDEFDSSNNYPCRGATKGQRDIERSRKKEKDERKKQLKLKTRKRQASPKSKSHTEIEKSEKMIIKSLEFFPKRFQQTPRSCFKDKQWDTFENMAEAET